MISLPFDSTKPVIGKASIRINKPIEEVFHFDRVEVTGLRPSPLPHHRQCGFPQRRLDPTG